MGDYARRALGLTRAYWSALRSRRKNTRTSGHDDCVLPAIEHGKKRRFEPFRMRMRINYLYALHADGFDELLDRQPCGCLSPQRAPSGGVLLLSGHCRRAIVENDHDMPGFGSIVNHLY